MLIRVNGGRVAVVVWAGDGCNLDGLRGLMLW